MNAFFAALRPLFALFCLIEMCYFFSGIFYPDELFITSLLQPDVWADRYQSEGPRTHWGIYAMISAIFGLGIIFMTEKEKRSKKGVDRLINFGVLPSLIIPPLMLLGWNVQFFKMSSEAFWTGLAIYTFAPVITWALLSGYKRSLKPAESPPTPA